MKRARITVLVIAVLTVCTIFVSAKISTVFSSKTVGSGGVTITQYECYNPDTEMDVSAVYHLYCRSNNDHTSKTHKGGTDDDPVEKTVYPSTSNYDTKHKLKVEYGSGVELDYEYEIK